MLRKLSLSFLGPLFLAVWSAASAQDLPTVHPFDRVFSDDAPGGAFILGEDQEISARFRQGVQGVDAKFQIIKPHRTAEYGSGVGFFIVDEAGNTSARVALRDTVGESTVTLIVWIAQSKGPAREVLKIQLSSPVNEVGRLTLRLDADRNIVVIADGKTHTFKPVLSPHSLYAQVYCAKGWIEYLDTDLTA